jgi:hypothetical protein
LAEKGTAVFIDRNEDVDSCEDDSLFVYDGWRWEEADNGGDHTHKDFTAHNSTLIRGPDSSDQTINFSGHMWLKTYASWKPEVHDLEVTAKDLTIERYAKINAKKDLTLNLSGDMSMDTGSLIDMTKVTVKGTSNAELKSSGRVFADNINWTGRNLKLSTTSNYISTTFRGASPSTGSGAGHVNTNTNCSGSGGSYGGRGGAGHCTASVRDYYGSAMRPVLGGSGGGSSWGATGGKSGGIVRINISGTLNNSGYISADGQVGGRSRNSTYRGAGGGTGGSIYVTTDRLTGSGRFQAKGGRPGGTHYSYMGGGGSGGRIMVEYNDATGFVNPRLSTVIGGYGYGRKYSDNGTLAFLEKDVRDLWIVEAWRWQQNDGPFSFRNVKITDSTSDSTAWVRDDGNATRIDAGLSITTDASSHWDSTASVLDIRTRRLDIGYVSKLTGSTLNISTAESATMDRSSKIEGDSVRLSGVAGWKLNSGAHIISDDLVLDQIGHLNLDGTSSYLKGNIRGSVKALTLKNTNNYIGSNGYGGAKDSGEGRGNSNYATNCSGSGGSHGGVGTPGHCTGNVRPFYGDLLAPTSPGSGGGSSWGATGGAGGGVIDLVVSGELVNNGIIRSNGYNGSNSTNNSYRGGGGGTGGSVKVTTKKLSGIGYFQAYGGYGGGRHNSYRGGGGGGGRVFVEYETVTPSRLQTYMNRVNVLGGYGFGARYSEKGTAAYLDTTEDHLRIYHGWRWEQNGAPYKYKYLTINNATVDTEPNVIEVEVEEDCSFKPSANWQSKSADLSLSCKNLTMDSGSQIDATGRTVTILGTGETVLNGTAKITAKNIAMLGSADITFNRSTRLTGNINLAGRRLNQKTGSYFYAQYEGYGQSSGPGAGIRNVSSNCSGSGASHGGRGGNGHCTSATNPSYGVLERPTAAGSGGGEGWGGKGGKGGGTIAINMTEAVDLSGYTYAMGQNGSRSRNSIYRGGGGGAGGSVLIETAQLTGRGPLYLYGGYGGGIHNSYKGGGGAGGRLATCVLANSYIGPINVRGYPGKSGVYAENGTIYDNCEPVLPEAAVVVSTGVAMPPAQVYAPGTQDVTVAQFKVREITNRNAVSIGSLRLNAAGSGDDSQHVSGVKLYLDENSNGRVDDGERLLGSGSFSADNGSVNFSSVGVELAAGGDASMLVLYSFAQSIPNNVTFQVKVADHLSMNIVKQGTTTTVPLYGAPVSGNSHRVFGTPAPIVSQLSPGTVSQGVESFTTLSGLYFDDATEVRLTDIDSTALTIISNFNGGTRMGVRVPSTVPVGTYHVRVTTPFGTNQTSGQRLTVEASCNTGLLGICAAGTDQGQGCVPRFNPGQQADVCGNGVDEDCNGEDLDCRFVDGDGDGFTPAQGDCLDTDRNVFPRDGLGCSAARDDLDTDGVPRAVVTYTPIEDGSDTSWTTNVQASWYQQAADTLVDSAAKFTEQGAYVEVPDSIFLQPFGDKITIGSWVNMDAVPTDGQHMIAFRGPVEGESYGMWYDAVHRCWVAVVQTTTGRHMVRFSRDIRARIWTHVAMAYTGSQLILYLDGVAVANTSASGNIVYGNSVMRVGGGQAGFRTLIGRIDEVVLFGREVSASHLSQMVRLNRMHKRRAWGNDGPIVRFSYDYGAREHDRKLPGTFHGSCRITGRSSTPTFPQFCSVVGTSKGFEIWDEPTGKLWARYWFQGDIPNSGIRLGSVDYVAAANGRIYLGSHTGNGGMVVLDYQRDSIEHWSTDGVSHYNGGIGVSNRGAGYGTVNGSGLRLPTNIVRRLNGWTDGGTTPYVGVACDEGVWVVEGSSPPRFSSVYMPQHDDVNTGASDVFRLLRGCGVERVGDDLYFGIEHRDDRRYDIVAGAPYKFENIDRRSYESMTRTSMVPNSWHTVYGRADNPVWDNFVTAPVNWGAVNDVAIIPNRSLNGQGGDDHVIALATPEGVVCLHQGDSEGDDSPGYVILKGENNGVSDDTTKYVLNGDVNNTMAVALRGEELFVGSQGAGVSRLHFKQDGEFEMLERYTTTSSVELPSDNITGISCGKNALISTDEGVASIRFAEPGPCTVEGVQGVCANGQNYLVNNRLTCVQTVFPRGETCDLLDNDCDGEADEHPIGSMGSICDVQDPVIEQLDDISLTTSECDGAPVLLPAPMVSDNNDPEPFLSNNAPALFEFGRTSVLWEAEDLDGNQSTMQHDVRLSYDGQPAIAIPEDITLEVSSPLGTPVSLGTPTGTICVPGGVSFSHDGPTNGRYPLGLTVVTWTGEGQQGRPATGVQRVTVEDKTPPSIEAGADQTVDTDDLIRLDRYVVSDNGSLSQNITVTHDAPDNWTAQQFTTVTFTATDEAGNSATDTMRVFVRFQTLPRPTIEIAGPTSAWHNPPVTMIAEVNDTTCDEMVEASVNSQDLTSTVTRLSLGRYRVETSRVSDGRHSLTMTVRSGCSGKTAQATRIFGVDSGGMQVLYSSLNQRGVRDDDPSTWPGVSNKSIVPGDVVLRDDRSGLATFKAELRTLAEEAPIRGIIVDADLDDFGSALGSNGDEDFYFSADDDNFYFGVSGLAIQGDGNSAHFLLQASGADVSTDSLYGVDFGQGLGWSYAVHMFGPDNIFFNTAGGDEAQDVSQFSHFAGDDGNRTATVAIPRSSLGNLEDGEGQLKIGFFLTNSDNDLVLSGFPADLGTGSSPQEWGSFSTVNYPTRVGANVDESTVLLSEDTFDERSGEPEGGLTIARVNYCQNVDVCEDGKLLLRNTLGSKQELIITLTDVAGNTSTNSFYFRSLGLREAIVAWNEFVAGVTTESDDAAALLVKAQAKLAMALVGYDTGYYGNMWLAVEDAAGLMRSARVFDVEIDDASVSLVVGRLGADFQADLVSQARQNFENPDKDASLAESDQRVAAARVRVDAETPGDALLELANSHFWMEEVRHDYVVDITDIRGKYARSQAVCELMLDQTQAYLDASSQLPGKELIGQIRAELVIFQDYQDLIVDRGTDLVHSDGTHMSMIMRLTSMAERLKEAEEETVWVRNWQWITTQMAWLYVNRAQSNAGSWVGEDHPLLREARASMDVAEGHRTDKLADDFMNVLIESRCMVIGVYNFAYPDSKRDVPDSCCELIRGYSETESRIEIPDNCLAPQEISILDGGLSDNSVSVKVGQEVRFINKSGASFSLTSGTSDMPTRSPFDSEAIATNGVFTHTFDTPGIYPYFDENDTDLEGTITVTE